MKKHVLVLGLLHFMLFGNSQKVVKMYYNNHLLSLDHQVDPKTGVENGYYKKYNYEGRLTEEGFYKMNKKNGVWKVYDNYGKVKDILTFRNDTLNGIQKEWCGESNTFFCKESFFKNGIETKTKTYFDNGQIETEIDNEKNIHHQWLKNGDAVEIDKAGKHYKYHLIDAYYSNPAYVKGIESIKFDTLGKHIKCYYGNDSALYEILVETITTDPNKKLNEKWDFNNGNVGIQCWWGDDQYGINSNILNKGLKYYALAPDPYHKNIKYEFDSLKYELKIYYPNNILRKSIKLLFDKNSSDYKIAILYNFDKGFEEYDSCGFDTTNGKIVYFTPYRKIDNTTYIPNENPTHSSYDYFEDISKVIVNYDNSNSIQLNKNEVSISVELIKREKIENNNDKGKSKRKEVKETRKLAKEGKEMKIAKLYPIIARVKEYNENGELVYNYYEYCTSNDYKENWNSKKLGLRLK